MPDPLKEMILLVALMLTVFRLSRRTVCFFLESRCKSPSFFVFLSLRFPNRFLASLAVVGSIAME